MKRKLWLSLLFAAVAGLAGCAVEPVSRPYYGEPVRMAPPPLRVEVMGAPPVVGYVWIGGYWNWIGVRYVWVPGRWEAPRPGYRWVPRQWERDGDRWQPRGGQWERHDEPMRDSPREHRWESPAPPRPQAVPQPARPGADGQGRPGYGYGGNDVSPRRDRDGAGGWDSRQDRDRDGIPDGVQGRDRDGRRGNQDGGWGDRNDRGDDSRRGTPGNGVAPQERNWPATDSSVEQRRLTPLDRDSGYRREEIRSAPLQPRGQSGQPGGERSMGRDGGGRSADGGSSGESRAAPPRGGDGGEQRQGNSWGGGRRNDRPGGDGDR